MGVVESIGGDGDWMSGGVLLPNMKMDRLAVVRDAHNRIVLVAHR